jgi:hypothetical protein
MVLRNNYRLANNVQYILNYSHFDDAAAFCRTVYLAAR